MIKLSDKLTAKTVENILGESKEIAYVYGDANPRSENTVASNLNKLNDEIIQKVNIGDIVGDVSGTWQQGSVEQYVDNRINELEVQVNRKLAIQQDKINTMNGNECVTVNTLPQTGTVGVVYRVPNDPDTEHYSDYMWDTSIATPAWKKLAEYTIPGIDQKPTNGSENLVESGGVFDEIVLNSGAFDLTAYNSGTTYASLSAALSVMDSSEYTPYKKGGMSIKFVQSLDNNSTRYVQYMYIGTATTGNPNPFLDVDNWQCIDCASIFEHTEAEVSILPNILNRWEGIDALIINSFQGAQDGCVNEYMLEFTVSGDNFTLTLPDGVRWVEEPTWEDGYTYQVSIINNLAVFAGWEGQTNE